MTNEKRFPIQGGLTVSWEAAERAYRYYDQHFGNSPSLECLAEQGGFGLSEFARFYHDEPTFGMANFAALERRRVSALVAGDVRRAPGKEDYEAFEAWRREVDQDRACDQFDLALGWFSGRGWPHVEALIAARKVSGR